MIDSKPYKTFKQIKGKYPNVVILITAEDFQRAALFHNGHRSLIASMFKEKGVEVTRWVHNYKSIDSGINPELGLVYLANDSEIMPGIEVHALIGHNARYVTSEDLNVATT